MEMFLRVVRTDLPKIIEEFKPKAKTEREQKIKVSGKLPECR